MVLNHHLHFTQIPSLEKVDHDTKFFEGFHITTQFDYDFKSISRHDVCEVAWRDYAKSRFHLAQHTPTLPTLT